MAGAAERNENDTCVIEAAIKEFIGQYKAEMQKLLLFDVRAKHISALQGAHRAITEAMEESERPMSADPVVRLQQQGVLYAKLQATLGLVDGTLGETPAAHMSVAEAATNAFATLTQGAGRSSSTCTSIFML